MPDSLRNIQDAPTLPGRWPLLGHLPVLRRDSLNFFRSHTAKLGPVHWVDMGFGHRVLMVQGEDGFSVFRSKDTDSSHMNQFKLLMGESMMTVDGLDHKRMRGASAAAFTPAGLSRARVGEIVSDTLRRRIEEWWQRDQVILMEETKSIAIEIIFRLMAIDVQDLPQWTHWYGEFTIGAINIPINLPGMPAWRGRRGRRWLEARMGEIIADARRRGDRDSIVGSFAHGRDEDGQGMSEQELLDNLLILAFAGHDTVASTMAWSLLYLAKSPQHWDRLCEEVASFGDVPLDYSELVRLAPLAAAVFRESLRMNPPLALDSRMTKSPFELAGYRIVPGTVVGTSLALLARDPSVYEQPDEWRPERWMSLDRKPTPLENSQFGGGAHFCLGYHVALLEGASFLVHAVRRLAAWGKRPVFDGPLPQPVFFPTSHPPASTKLRLG